MIIIFAGKSKVNPVIVDDEINEVMWINEIDRLPINSKKHDNTPIVGREKQALTETIKSGVNFPNKTIQVEFSPEISKALNSGKLYLMPSKEGTIPNAMAKKPSFYFCNYNR